MGSVLIPDQVTLADLHLANGGVFPCTGSTGATDPTLATLASPE